MLTSAHRAREPGLWGRLPLLLAMLAIAMQALVLQPHAHATAPGQHEISAVSSHAADSALTACAICQTAASARVFTAPPALALTARDHAMAHAPQAADQSVTRTPLMAWRSRAPPSALS